MESSWLEKAFVDFREPLLKLAERTLHPALMGRFSPEDLLQETMLELRKDDNAFLHDEEIPLYIRLRAALVQRATDLERRHLGAQMRDIYREAHPVDAEGESLLELIPDPATSPLSRLAREERYALLRHVLGTLSPVDRGILELRHVDGLGNGESARLLGVSEKAASLRYTRALLHLKDALENYSEFRP